VYADLYLLKHVRKHFLSKILIFSTRAAHMLLWVLSEVDNILF